MSKWHLSFSTESGLAASKILHYPSLTLRSILVAPDGCGYGPSEPRQPTHVCKVSNKGQALRPIYLDMDFCYISPSL